MIKKIFSININIQNSETIAGSTIQVINLQGQILQSNLTKDLSNFKFKMDYTPGVYFVKIVQNNKVHIVYTWKRKTVKYVVLDLEKLK